MPTGAFIICCPRDCVSRHNGGTVGAPLKPLRDTNMTNIKYDKYLNQSFSVICVAMVIEQIPLESYLYW